MVSIIIPVYNSENFIEKTIDSCLIQTYQDIEVIIIDDNSNDKSLELINEKYSADSRVKILANEKNMGLIKTVNRGIRISKGEYILTLGNDDILDQNHIEIMLKSLQDENYSFAYCSSRYIDEFEKYIGESNTIDINKNKTILARKNPINSCGLLIKKEKLELVNGYPEIEYFPNYGEWYLWIKLLEVGSIKYVKDVKSNYRIHSNNLTKSFLHRDKIRGTMKYNLMCMKYGKKVIKHNFKERILFYRSYYIYIIKMIYLIYIKRG